MSAYFVVDNSVLIMGEDAYLICNQKKNIITSDPKYCRSTVELESGTGTRADVSHVGS